MDKLKIDKKGYVTFYAAAEYNGKLYIDEVYPFVVESSCLQDKWIHWCTNLGL